jgi:3'(2'), 5'-bisphosphate nucleotidase
MIDRLINIAQTAGQIVLSIYNQPSIQVMNKDDKSVLTKADLASHDYICGELKKHFPSIPVISEESTQQFSYEERKDWEYFFLVDPLDGTKEFIQRNGEFTINIALVKNNKPIVGVIHVPVLGITYYAEENKGSYKIINNKITQLTQQSKVVNTLRVVTSRSHGCKETDAWLNALAAKGNEIIIKTAGSALKFGLVAEGEADIYPRFAPTMEWDTAAGQVIVNEVGKQVTVVGGSEPLLYNKRDLRNPGFIVQ